MSQAITRKFFLSQKIDNYYAAFIDNRECLIELDEVSENLELGEQMLHVENSILNTNKIKRQNRIKLKGIPTFKLIKSDQADTVTLTIDRFNKYYATACRNAGGRYCSMSKEWSFNISKKKEVDYLRHIYESEERVYEIDISNMLSAPCQSLDILGYPIARFNFDKNQVQLSSSVAIMTGSIVARGNHNNKFVLANNKTVIRVLLPHLVVERSGSKKFMEI
jgi:hypothetical protein